MSSTTTKAKSSGLYIPADHGSSSTVIQGTALQDAIERTMEQIDDLARREPWTFATCVLGVGFILGWKLKPW